MPSATRVRAFVIVFTLFFLAALFLVVAGEFSDVEWVGTALRIAEGIGRLTFVAVAATFIIVEGVPMLASWIRRQEINQAREEGREVGIEEGRKEGREEGREVGREEGREVGLEEGRSLERESWLDWKKRLDEWEERRIAAAEENRPFDEERPLPPDSET